MVLEDSQHEQDPQNNSCTNLYIFLKLKVKQLFR